MCRTYKILETMREHEIVDLDQYTYEDHPDHYSKHFRHNERWVRIAGWEDYYSVSNHGRVRTELLDTRNTRFPGRLLTSTNCNGYLHVGLNDGFRHRVAYVHRLVAAAFIPNPEGKPHINHKDGNRANNRIVNLEWCTNKENIRHYFAELRPLRTGIPYIPPIARPKRVSRKVLNEDMVREIRKMYTSGVRPCEIAKNLRINPATILSVTTGRHWKKVV